ncbi:hypothetical protein GCM10011385_27290 [Nitratireductor aestuarii]|uniref:Polymerase nucleotidyl transferase domain-containing protein n=1 Tax=Nitratireductor aestuarii TaxID=1735103 RepID=A0A916RV35_9HYPH|nr:nucleotidyltransferase domain-containing protein [Nitratireductor aestuarii]GGA71978.1 hypothetical protein GCM10011385_27290 [Nitratireductor aestuarii]
MEYLEKRRSDTERRFEELRGLLGKAIDLVGDKACVYATGSFGRLEAGQNSDLDLFIVSKTATKNGFEIRQLSNLDEILVKANLISALRELGMPEFDSDGKYLSHYSVKQFTDLLGKPDDDANNTLTGRLLLFLESRPLIGQETYDEIIGEVIASYWRDYSDHAQCFMPAFLANDILRLWRTFCVNYEANTKTVPEEKKIQRKIKNDKLKHSRMLTCYSALLFLLGVFKREETVSLERAMQMTQKTPTERLQWLLDQKEFGSIHDTVIQLLDKYAQFLERTDKPKAVLESEVKANWQSWTDESYEFGDLMFKALSKLGEDNKFYRLLVV